MRVRTLGKGPRSPYQRAHEYPDFPTRDHVIPKTIMPAMGTLVVCRSCNMDKANRTLDTWHAHLVASGDPRAKRVHTFMVENKAYRLPVRP